MQGQGSTRRASGEVVCLAVPSPARRIGNSCTFTSSPASGRPRARWCVRASWQVAPGTELNVGYVDGGKTWPCINVDEHLDIPLRQTFFCTVSISLPSSKPAQLTLRLGPTSPRTALLSPARCWFSTLCFSSPCCAFAAPNAGKRRGRGMRRKIPSAVSLQAQLMKVLPHLWLDDSVRCKENMPRSFHL